MPPRPKVKTSAIAAGLLPPGIEASDALLEALQIAQNMIALEAAGKSPPVVPKSGKKVTAKLSTSPDVLPSSSACDSGLVAPGLPVKAAGKLSGKAGTGPGKAPKAPPKAPLQGPPKAPPKAPPTAPSTVQPKALPRRASAKALAKAVVASDAAASEDGATLLAAGAGKRVKAPVTPAAGRGRKRSAPATLSFADASSSDAVAAPSTPGIPPAPGRKRAAVPSGLDPWYQLLAMQGALQPGGSAHSLVDGAALATRLAINEKARALVLNTADSSAAGGVKSDPCAVPKARRTPRAKQQPSGEAIVTPAKTKCARRPSSSDGTPTPAKTERPVKRARKSGGNKAERVGVVPVKLEHLTAAQSSKATSLGTILIHESRRRMHSKGPDNIESTLEAAVSRSSASSALAIQALPAALASQALPSVATESAGSTAAGTDAPLAAGEDAAGVTATEVGGGTDQAQTHAVIDPQRDSGVSGTFPAVQQIIGPAVRVTLDSYMKPGAAPWLSRLPSENASSEGAPSGSEWGEADMGVPASQPFDPRDAASSQAGALALSSEHEPVAAPVTPQHVAADAGFGISDGGTPQTDEMRKLLLDSVTDARLNNKLRERANLDAAISLACVNGVDQGIRSIMDAQTQLLARAEMLVADEKFSRSLATAASDASPLLVSPPCGSDPYHMASPVKRHSASLADDSPLSSQENSVLEMMLQSALGTTTDETGGCDDADRVSEAPTEPCEESLAVSCGVLLDQSEQPSQKHVRASDVPSIDLTCVQGVDGDGGMSVLSLESAGKSASSSGPQIVQTSSVLGGSAPVPVAAVLGLSDAPTSGEVEQDTMTRRQATQQGLDTFFSTPVVQQLLQAPAPAAHGVGAVQDAFGQLQSSDGAPRPAKVASEDDKEVRELMSGLLKKADEERQQLIADVPHYDGGDGVPMEGKPYVTSKNEHAAYVRFDRRRVAYLKSRGECPNINVVRKLGSSCRSVFQQWHDLDEPPNYFQGWEMKELIVFQQTRRATRRFKWMSRDDLVQHYHGRTNVVDAIVLRKASQGLAKANPDCPDKPECTLFRCFLSDTEEEETLLTKSTSLQKVMTLNQECAREALTQMKQTKEAMEQVARGRGGSETEAAALLKQLVSMPAPGNGAATELSAAHMVAVQQAQEHAKAGLHKAMLESQSTIAALRAVAPASGVDKTKIFVEGKVLAPDSAAHALGAGAADTGAESDAAHATPKAKPKKKNSSKQDDPDSPLALAKKEMSRLLSIANDAHDLIWKMEVAKFGTGLIPGLQQCQKTLKGWYPLALCLCMVRS